MQKTVQPEKIKERMRMKKLLLTMTTLLTASYAFGMQRAARQFSAHAYDATKVAAANREQLRKIAEIAAQLPGPGNQAERAELILSQARRYADPAAYIRNMLTRLKAPANARLRR
jgi:hypothetical protein